MKLYLAGNVPREWKGDLFKGANILQSFYYQNEHVKKEIIPNCKNFLLDSGAFTFMSSGKEVNYKDYIDKYCDFVIENKIKNYFELDIDSIVGFENVLKIRNYLEQRTGVKPIPVWHKKRGLQRFEEDSKNYPYVAIGGIVTKEIKPDEYPAFSKLIKIAHSNGAKIHGLGFTNLKGIQIYHFDSVDSTSWLSGSRFGGVFYFDGKTIKKIDKPPNKRMSKDSRIHNYEEWKKFGLYAEKHFKKVRIPHEKNQFKTRNSFNSLIRNLLFN